MKMSIQVNVEVCIQCKKTRTQERLYIFLYFLSPERGVV